MSGREPEFAEFAPERISGPRRRLDPVLIGAVVVVGALVVAVAKPWGGDPAPATDVAAIPSPSLAAQASTAPAPALSQPPPGRVGLEAPLLGWRDADAVVEPRGAWGIRTLIADHDPDPQPKTLDARTTVIERWTEVRADRSPTDDVALLSGERAILALGLTFPPGQAPLDARLWRAVEDGWEWLAADPLAPNQADGAFLYAPPRIAGGYLTTWPPGRYRLEWLGETGIEQVTFRIAGRFNAGGPSLAPLKPPDRDLPSPLRPSFVMGDDDRLFTVTRGIATGLTAPGTIPLDAARAWLDSIGRPTSRYPAEVAGAFLPEVNGLGVLLPTDARGADGTIVSLGPASVALDAQRSIGVRFGDGRETRAPYVVFRPRGGGTWLPGVYRLDVSWTGLEGPRRTSYHVEVRPG